MPEKTPRLRPIEQVGTQWGKSAGLTLPELASIGSNMYHPPLTPDQQRKLGQTSLLDVVPPVE